MNDSATRRTSTSFLSSANVDETTIRLWKIYLRKALNASCIPSHLEMYDHKDEEPDAILRSHTKGNPASSVWLLS
jgi:hypothetical protein